MFGRRSAVSTPLSAVGATACLPSDACGHTERVESIVHAGVPRKSALEVGCVFRGRRFGGQSKLCPYQTEGCDGVRHAILYTAHQHVVVPAAHLGGGFVGASVGELKAAAGLPERCLERGFLAEGGEVDLRERAHALT